MAAKNLRICLVGGSGFVSGTLVRIALAAGHQVWVVTRGQRPLLQGVHAIRVDRNNRAAFSKAMAAIDGRFDLAVDCIGYVEGDARQDISVFRDRCSHFVFISTDFVFDPRRRIFPTPVEHTQLETKLPYGRQKRQCELQFIESETHDMAWTIVCRCHVYGLGLPLGCLPMHSRDLDLITKIRNCEPIRLVGGGYFLQQPILAEDLGRLVSAALAIGAAGKIYMSAGPDIIESRDHYQLIADVLGVELIIDEVPVESYAREHPEHAPFLCHRIYDLQPMRNDGLTVPDTPIAEGIRQFVHSQMTPGLS